MRANHSTTLHSSCASGDAAAVRALLRQGADLYGVDENGWTPMHHAADSGSFATVR